LVKWTAPSDDDVAGYRIYLDGNLVNATIRGTQYTITGLKHSTDYKVYVVAVDTSNNASQQSSTVDFKTLELQTTPVKPTISGTPFSGGALLNWSPVVGAESYKLYQNGVLIETTSKTSLRLSGLTNEVSYNFYVVASNSIGDSEPSNTVLVMPSIKSVPEVSIGYKLKDVADGTSSWFNSYWLILAFSLSIPLSFYVSNRIKGLFVS
jgi:chitodextrinase